MAVDRRLRDAGSRDDTVDREAAEPALGQLRGRGLENRGAAACDSRINRLFA
jgi:hypothetical protein